ncbi:unnamed protein product, partial [Rotaria sordida]
MQKTLCFAVLASITTTTPSPSTLPPNQVCATAIWNSTFNLAAGTGAAGSTATLLYNPYDVFIDGQQSIYVVDNYNNRVQKYLAGSNVSTTVAGLSLTVGLTPTAGSASPQFNSPTGIFVDLTGIIYVADYNNYRVQKWLPGDPFGSTVAGGHGPGTTLDKIGGVQAIYVDAQSNIYVSEYTNHRVSLWTAGNTTAGKLVAGTSNGVAGSGANQLNYPWDIYVISNGTLYIVDQTQLPNQVCATAQWNATFSIVGGTTSTSGNTASRLNSPYDVFVDGYGNIYVADYSNNRIQRFTSSPVNGTTVAGVLTSGSGYSQLYLPTAIFLDANRTLYILDSGNYRVQKWLYGEPLGFTVAGGYGFGSTANKISTSYGLFVDRQSNIYISDTANHRVVFWQARNTTTGRVIAGGNGASIGANQLYNPRGIFVDSTNALYIADYSNHRVQKWLSGASNGITVAGDPSGASGSLVYQLTNPTAVIVDQYGNIYVLDSGNRRIQKWEPGSTFGITVVYELSLSSPLGMRFAQIPNQICAGPSWSSTFATVAGTGISGTSASTLYNPFSVYIDGLDTVYIADYNNHRVQKYLSGSTMGIQVAGFGTTAGTTGVYLNKPTAVFVNSNGVIYILDSLNYRVQQWSSGQPMGITVAGGRGQGAAYTQISTSYALYVDAQSNIYISDCGNNRIHFWAFGNTTAGKMVAGNNVAGNGANQLNCPWGIYVTSNGTMYIVDRNNHRIQRWLPALTTTTTSTVPPLTYASYQVCQNGVWSSSMATLAGTYNSAGSTTSLLSSPYDVFVDGNNNVFVADYSNNRIQRFAAGSTIGTNVAGITLSGGSGFNELYGPSAIFVTPNGVMYIVDTLNYRVQKWVYGEPLGLTVAGGRGLGTLYTQIGTSYGLWAAGNTAAGARVAGGNGAGGASTQLYYPWGIYVSNISTVYIADRNNHRIQRWLSGATSGTNVAGTGVAGSAATQLSSPRAVIMDQFNYLYILDTGNNRVQRWALGATSGITIVSSTSFLAPSGMHFGPPDSLNYRVQKWIPGQLNGTTVAGGQALTTTTTTASYPTQSPNQICQNGVWNISMIVVAGTTGVSGPNSTRLTIPYDAFVDGKNNTFVVDYGNHRIQRCSAGSTVGTTVAGFTRTGGSGFSELRNPSSVYVTPDGILYILDNLNYRVQKWIYGEPLGFTVAGGRGSGTSLTQISAGYGLFVDNQYNVYVSEYGNHRVSMWTLGNTASGTRVAGGNGAGTGLTQLYYPWGIFVTSLTNVLYIADWQNHRIQKWLYGATSGTTVAGVTGSSGSTANKLYGPKAVVVDQFDYLYILDTGNKRIQRWAPGATSGVTIISSTSWNNPTGMRLGPSGSLVLTDTNNHRVISFPISCPITTTTMSTTTQPLNQVCSGSSWNSAFTIMVGTGTSGTSSTQLSSPMGVFIDGSQNIYVADYLNNRIQKFVYGATVGTTVAGATTAGSAANRLNRPSAIFVDSAGVMYIADTLNYRVQRWPVGSALGYTVAVGIGDRKLHNSYVGATTGVTVAGQSGIAGSWSYQLNNPTHIKFDLMGNMYVMDAGNKRIQRWSPGSTYGVTVVSTTALLNGIGIAFDLAATPIVTVAPLAMAYPLPCLTGSFNNTGWKVMVGSTSNPGSTSTTLRYPNDVYVDASQYIFVADSSNHRIQRFAFGSTLGTTVAGTGSSGSSLSELNFPTSIFVDSSRNMYIADGFNNRVLKWQIGTPMGVIVAGIAGPKTTLDTIASSYAIYVDAESNLYVSECGNNRVTRWIKDNTTDGQLVAGGNGRGTKLYQLKYPWGIYADSSRTVYVVDQGNHRVMMWASGATSGVIIAGQTGVPGSSANQLNTPTTITFDILGFMFIMDSGNNRVLRFTLGSTVGATVATLSTFNVPRGMFIDYKSDLYVADQNNHRVMWFTCVINETTTSTTTKSTSTTSTTTTTTTSETSTTSETTTTETETTTTSETTTSESTTTETTTTSQTTTTATTTTTTSETSTSSTTETTTTETTTTETTSTSETTTTETTTTETTSTSATTTTATTTTSATTTSQTKTTTTSATTTSATTTTTTTTTTTSETTTTETTTTSETTVTETTTTSETTTTETTTTSETTTTETETTTTETTTTSETTTTETTTTSDTTTTETETTTTETTTTSETTTTETTTTSDTTTTETETTTTETTTTSETTTTDTTETTTTETTTTSETTTTETTTTSETTTTDTTETTTTETTATTTTETTATTTSETTTTETTTTSETTTTETTT